jgi:UPF0271 protein
VPGVQAIDLTADVGELDGPAGRAHDALLIEATSTVHVACGGHIGDVSSMAASIEACLAHGTAIGAHPSYPDRDGFGRRAMGMDPSAVAEAVLDQVTALDRVASDSHASVVSVKPHGQLYHDLSSDLGLAEAVLGALVGSGYDRVVLAAGSAATLLANDLGITLVAEGFCDRRYAPNGMLVVRTEPGAVLEDPAEASAQAVELASQGVRVNGVIHQIDALCVHSDSPGAVAMLEAVRAELDRRGFRIRQEP